MKKLFLLLPVTLFILSCNQNKKEENKDIARPSFNLLGIIKGQVKLIDSSLYSIRKIIIYDSTRSDTTYVPREEVAGLAKDFLGIPDVTSKEYKKRYTEEIIYDSLMNRIIISYQPIDPDKELLKSQEALAIPQYGTDSKIITIISKTVKGDRNGFEEKNMLWQVDRYFQIATTTQKPGQPETTTIMKVVWNEEEDE